MNIAAIKKRCIEYGQCILITNRDAQWIGTGREFYPVHGVKLTEEGIPGLFGLTKKEKDEIEIREEHDALEVMLGGVVLSTDEPCAEKLIDVNFGTGVLRQVIGRESGEKRWYYVNGAVPAKRKDAKHDLFMRGNCLLLANGMIVEAVVGMLDKGEQGRLEDALRKMLSRMEEEAE